MLDRNIGIYNTALKNSRFDQTLTYDEQGEPTRDSVNEESNQTSKRKRNIIWYNPPYSMNVKTNVGKVFFKLLRKNFPPSHPMYTIFNTNKVKVSYSCFCNIGLIISSHNKKILYSDNTKYGCKCNDKNKCSLDNKCLTPKLYTKTTSQMIKLKSKSFIMEDLTHPSENGMKTIKILLDTKNQVQRLI